MDSVQTKAALAEACSTLEQALQTCASLEEKNASLQQEKNQLSKQLSDLQAKLANQEKVVLEKVAKAAKAASLDEAIITETIGQLVDLSLVSKSDTEKLASHLRQDANAALQLVQRVATLSIPSHSEGRVVEKSASHLARESDMDGWGKVISQGAA